MGKHALFGSHFVLHNGFRQLRIHTDGGGELNAAAVDEILLTFGLSANVTSTPHTPSSNGVAERHVQTLVLDAIALLAMSGLPKRLWHYAMRHACSMRNRVASQRVESDGVVRFVLPFELFYWRQPDVKQMVAFGAPCRVLLVGPERDAVGKLGVPSVRGCVIGYGGDGVQIGGSVRLILGFVVVLGDGRVVFSRSVEIDERPPVEGGHTLFRATSARDGDEQQQQCSAQQAAQQHAEQQAAARQPAVAFADEMRMEHDP
jgi:hypothetical protein